MDILIVHTTAKNKKEANKITNALLESNLAACVQRLRINSSYIWNDKICNDKEYLLIIKSSKECLDSIQKIIIANHSYEIPEIVSYLANASKAYGTWLNSSIRI